jgi:hypothetical protein
MVVFEAKIMLNTRQEIVGRTYDVSFPSDASVSMAMVAELYISFSDPFLLITSTSRSADNEDQRSPSFHFICYKNMTLES